MVPMRMSRSATEEYLKRMKDRYAAMRTKMAKSRILTEFAEAAGFERKYALKLLTGNRRYRRHAGRGRTYGAGAERLLARLWMATGQTCSKYLKVMLPSHMAALEELEPVDGKAKAEVLAMSPATMDRLLKNRRVDTCRWRNRRSGRNPYRDLVPCRPGQEARAPSPGSVQMDTVALCGGDLSGSFVWILTVTDRLTQWTECRPAWNRGAHNTFQALEQIEEALPFEIRDAHSDNGGEFLNAHVYRYLKDRDRPCGFTRSRPYRKNDNAHAEQKNSSVVRDLFGYDRIDDESLMSELAEICRMWSRYCNYFRPCVSLVESVREQGRRRPRKKYDAPMTPAERLLRSGTLPDAQADILRETVALANSLRLYAEIQRRLSRVYSKLSEPRKTGGADSGGVPPPSGPPVLRKQRLMVSSN